MRVLFRQARKMAGWRGVVPRGVAQAGVVYFGVARRDGSGLFGQFEVGKRRWR